MLARHLVGFWLGLLAVMPLWGLGLDTQIERPSGDEHDRHVNTPVPKSKPQEHYHALAPPPGGRLHERIERLDAQSWMIGPFPWAGVDVRFRVSELPGARFQASWQRAGESAEAATAAQSLFRRLIIGPLSSEQLGVRVDGWPTVYWLLIREGDLRVVTQQGEPRYFDDEWAFELAFERVDLSSLSQTQRLELKDRFWAEEAARWEQRTTQTDQTGP